MQTTYTRSQIEKACKAAGIAAEFTGRGRDFSVELADEKAMRKFRKTIAPFGGYRTGYGAWVVSPSGIDMGDFNDKSSRWHY